MHRLIYINAMHFIYFIFNKINEKIYIGQTINPKKRWSRHISDAKCASKKMRISHAINKYGKNNFIFEIFEKHETLECTNKAEEFWINFLNSTNRKVGYNVSPGGNNRLIFEEPKTKLSTISKKPPNSGSFITTINWPSDQKLLEMVNAKGCTAVAKELNCSASSVSKYLIRNKLKHNSRPGSLETYFKKGLDHHRSKLTPEQVLEIVKFYQTKQYTYEGIAKLFNVTRMAIKNIIIGQSWSHLTGIQYINKSST